ncbi:MAG TPA: hypothetical protein VNA19_02790 [Pyrinomonadaceae bacterium]|jgi:hypothetical protein|nr:hypothetical protein [Pyrinomonadaceae bacterium]
MNPSDYRREYSAFCSAFERERHAKHAGLDTDARAEPLAERYADLWTLQSVQDLRRALDETPVEYETERASLRALSGAARAGHLRARTRDVTDELRRCESAARVVWKDTSATLDEMPDVLAQETDAARRRELSARWLDAVSACDDLRAERLALADESARELGMDNLRALYAETTRADFEKLAADADQFLQQTNARYYSQLAQFAARQTSPAQEGVPQHADSFHFRRLPHLDPYFPARDLRTTYAATLEGLGIRVGRQQNVHIDDEARAGKGAHTECFGTNPPEEVLLVVGARESGAELFRNFFEAAGRAQFYAWTSRETAARRPEFVHAPDRATREAYALLFRGLFLDAAWVGERRYVRVSEAREIALSCALTEMHDARLACARLRFWLTLTDATADARSEQLAETYATLHTEATGFRYQAATMLLDACAAERAAESLRARLFAAGLTEYLRERHGHRWWASRRAGDELIDVWNTASRYSVEELARLVGVGEPDFALLAEGLLNALSE